MSLKKGDTIDSRDCKDIDVLKTATLGDIEDLAKQLISAIKDETDITGPELHAFEAMAHKAAIDQLKAVTDAVEDICTMLDLDDHDGIYALLFCFGIISCDSAITFLGNLSKRDMLSLEEEDDDCERCCPKCGGECEPEDGIKIDGDGILVCRCKECGFEWIS